MAELTDQGSACGDDRADGLHVRLFCIAFCNDADICFVSIGVCFLPEIISPYSHLMYQRMDAIRELGNMCVLYVESVYVREDYRQLGLFRMCIDVLREMCGDCIMWLNMEPTAGAELRDEYSYFPNYTVSELGQVSLNASIAERLGFTIDPDTWRRQAEVPSKK